MDRHRLLRDVTSGGATSTGDTIELSHSTANHGSNNEAQRDAQRGNRATERGKAEKLVPEVTTPAEQPKTRERQYRGAHVEVCHKCQLERCQGS